MHVLQEALLIPVVQVVYHVHAAPIKMRTVEKFVMAVIQTCTVDQELIKYLKMGIVCYKRSKLLGRRKILL